MRRMKVFMITAGFLLTIPFFLPAQTAAELEAVLGTPAVSCTQAARFVLASSGSAASTGGAASGPISEGSAFEEVVARGWLKEAAPDDAISLGKLSFLMMKAFSMKGGMMYKFFPGPRYAYRIMVSRNFIQGAADPAMTVNGERFLLILGKVLSAEGEEQL